MRATLIILTILIFNLVLFSSGATAAPDIYGSLEASAQDEAFIVMEYLWVYGIDERVELRADGLLRVERHVHDRQLFDRLNADLAEKGDLPPYGWEIYAMEEGDYDAYWVADVGTDAFDEIINILTEIGFPDIEESFGDWEVWAITLRGGDNEARVGQVLRDWDVGFETALIAIDELIAIAKDGDQVDEEEYIEWFEEPEEKMGGVS